MQIQTITWTNNKVKIIDQRHLPLKLKYEYIDNVHQMWRAIRELRIRGAPAIGVAAAFGLYLGVRHWRGKDSNKFFRRVCEVADYLATARPTAVNLFWALEKVKAQIRISLNKPVPELKKMLLSLALGLLEDDRQRCEAIGKNGADLLPESCTILTHCNAGALATAGMGTALAVIYTAQKQGKKVKVFADETRPLLQGARLTAWELKQSGIDVTLICDNMSATLMAQGKIHAVLVGADRICVSGDFANKIGTYALAVLAHHHKVKFYVAAPLSSFDPNLKSGKDIPIEFRPPEEVTTFGNKRCAPPNIKVYNPAFDVTPARFVTAFITEREVITPPFTAKIKKLLNS